MKQTICFKSIKHSILSHISQRDTEKVGTFQDTLKIDRKKREKNFIALI